MRAARRRTATGLALLSPTLLGVAAFFVVPAVALIWMSTQRWDLLSAPRFDGLASFAAVLADPATGRALLVTVEIGGIALAVELVLGFALGRLLAAHPAGRVAAVLLLLPWMIAPLVVGVIARWIAAPSSGVVAHLLGHRIDVLADPLWAPVVVAAAMAWQSTGFAAVIYAGSIARIPLELRDAAALDGAGRWRTIRSVELPLLVPTVLFLAIAGVVRAVGLYDLVVPLTGGGPAGATRPLTALIVSWAWGAGDFGRAAALSLLVGGVVLVVVAALWLLARRVDHAR